LRATPPTSSELNAATPSRVPAPSSWSSQIVVKAPTDNCVSTSMNTSGQCGWSGATCVRSRGRASGGMCSGSVIRVVDRLPSPTGVPAGG
jgi:hypothetical protein